MPSILLGLQSGSYLTGFVRVYVSDETKPKSSMFLKYRHQPISKHSTGYIYLYPGSYALGSYATFRPQGNYDKASLKYADVYFNRFDESKTPILCVLKFSNGRDLIYKNSVDRFFINHNLSNPITSLTEFDANDEKRLLELLIEESDKHLNSVTYELGKTNTTGRSISYNKDKITLSTSQLVAPHLTRDLYKYTHTPQDRRPKKSFLLLNNNTPMASRDRPARDIQGHEYDTINVYYNINDPIPLLIELITNNKRRHLHRITTDGLLWLRNDISDSREEGLIKYLNFTTKFVKEKKQEERREQQRVQGRGRGIVHGPRGRSSHETHGTAESGSQTTQTTHETTTISSPRPGVPATTSQDQTSTSTAKICVLINKQANYKKSEVQGICKPTTKPEAQPIDVQPETISVKSSDFHGTDYKYYTHDIKPDSTRLNGLKIQDIDIELTIYISKIDISLFNSGGVGKEHLMYNSKLPENKLYVYFYEPKNQPGQADKIPLMFHYDGKFFGPSKRDNYFTGWNRINGIRNAQDIFKIKNNLTRIYNELNKVELSKTPKDKCTYGILKPSNVTITDFKTDRIKVKVEQIGSTSDTSPGSTSNGSCIAQLTCPKGPYVKYTHTTINKFQLGNIYYKSNLIKVIRDSDSAASSGNPISIGPTQNLVSVYYWINDKTCTYPLLIGIGKQQDGPESAVLDNIDDYYKLISTGTGAGTSNYKWQKLSEPENSGLSGTDNKKLLELLNKINYSVKKVIKIYIDKQGEYEVYLSKNAGGQGNEYSRKGGTNIEVKACDDSNGCSKLSDRGYICYQHKVSEINSGVRFDYNTIGGLKFFISGTSGNDVEIPLQNDDGPLTEITYNKCMGDVYVYFYCKQGSGSRDHVPLMLIYNGGYYSPQDRDDYFYKWDEDSTLNDVTALCGADNGISDVLATMLDRVNAALNRIDLTPSIVSGISTSATSQYGISKPSKPASTVPQIVLNRIQVTKIPTQATDNRPYCKLVHRTMNSFNIGDIYYNNQDITEGVTINGASGHGTTIETGSRRHRHTVFVQNNNRPNTVIAYYSISDTGYKLPQVIILMTTKDPIDLSDKPITSSDNTQYGYYLLSTDKNDGGYKYKWRRPTDSEPQQLTLNDKTEFSLLNSIVILVDKQTHYDESAIKAAAKSAKIKSPGKVNDVNRLKDSTINVAEETGSNAHLYGKPAKCISQYGYKLYSHDIGTLVTWTGSNGQPSIPLIAGLRFLVPSSDEADKYDEVNLYPTDSTTGSVDKLYHISTGNQNKVYVFFYGSDPRPLLLCYGGSAYKPKKQRDPIPDRQVMVDYTSWVKDSKISQCTCMGGGLTLNDDHILNTLLDVLLFLNPVQLNPKHIPTTASTTITADPPKPPTPKEATYELHKFTANKTVQMKITRESVECYEKYIYQPDGTSKDGTGFRLGKVIYDSGTGGTKPKGTLKYTSKGHYKHHSLVKVTVYYYDHDKEYSDPLLIELDFKVNWSVETTHEKEYWKLTKNEDTAGNGMEWQLDGEAKEAIGTGEDNQKLIIYLDKIRYQFKKVLEIKIAIKQETHYSANLLDRDSGQPVEPQDEINVTVSEEHNCQSIKGTGFRCFKHKITELESQDLHKFAALRFVIPDQQGDQVKLNLYDTPRTVLLNPLYYNCGMGDIYVYFYGKGNGNGDQGQGNGDPRPLLLCYNKQAFRARSMTTYDSQVWFKAKKINNCVCEKNTDKNLLPALAHVSNFLNPVWIHETSGIYNIHKFNGQQISIKITETPGSAGFCYNKYTHIHNGTGSGGTGFRLGRIEHNNHCIRSEIKPHFCINSLTSKSPKFEPALEIVIYYYLGDKTYQNPLLIALKNTTSKYQPYYEIQNSSSSSIKRYKKESKEITLDDQTGTDLEKILDRILFNISKRLQIILDKRPDPIKLCPIERKRIKLSKTEKPFSDLTYSQIGYQLFKDTINVSSQMTTSIVDEGIFSYKNPNTHEYINKGSCQERENNEWDPKIKTRTPFYKARVYKNDGQQEKGVSGTAQIKVQKMEVPGLSDKGYVCYKHKLLNIPNINEFNGLRLFLWDNRNSNDNDDQDCKIKQPITNTKHNCCELDLYEDTSPVQPIAYTTCKGDLYVYFYGSDPRPMLLCYNGQSYTGRIFRVI